MLVTPGEAWGQAILWQAASKRLNVNKMHMPSFTFGLFEAVCAMASFFPRLRLGLLGLSPFRAG